MRRKDREIIDFNEMLHILEASEVLRLALADEETPYIVPLNFGYENRDGTLLIYLHGAKEGKKLELIQKNGAASFEVDTNHRLSEADTACDYSYFYSSVVGSGKIEILTKHEDKVHGLKQVMMHYAHDRAEEIPMKDELVGMTCVIRLTVSQWSGKQH